MKHLLYVHEKNVTLMGALIRGLWHRTALAIVPRLAGAVSVFTSPTARGIILRVVIMLALVAQLLLLWLLGEMVDLCISLMEVWAELARKHLELTM